MEVALQQLQLN